MRARRLLATTALVSALSLALPALATARPPIGAPSDITSTSKGHDLAAEVAARHEALGVKVRAADLRVWRLGPGDYLVGRTLPRNLTTATHTTADGATEYSMTFDTELAEASANVANLTTEAGTLAATWTWQSQGCFTRLQNASGYLDSCYALHKLTGESDPKDYYKLEQYGTVAAKQGGKIYDGSLSAVKASSSSAMSWIDWSPRGTLSGSCQGVPLSVSALGVSFSASGVMCERWNIYKGSAAGQFKEEWSCGCIVPFGQPYPNAREIDYLQAVSVANGGHAVWTLSATFRAFPGS